MKKWVFALLCVLLLMGCGALAEDHGDLTRCEYSRFGGMENEDFSITLAQADSFWYNTVTVNENGVVSVYQTTWKALDDLAEYIARQRPEEWADIPYTEYIALDAPTRVVTVYYEDGSEFSLRNDREDSWRVLNTVYYFLESCTVSGRDVFTLTFSSFDGGGPEYRPVISAPEMLAWDSYSQYHEPYDPMATGSGYDVILEFRGRVPGKVDMYIETCGPLVSLDPDVSPTVYTLYIDQDYNVRLAGTTPDRTGGSAPRDNERLTVTLNGGEVVLGGGTVFDLVFAGWHYDGADGGVHRLHYNKLDTALTVATRDGGMFTPIVSLALPWDGPAQYLGYSAGGGETPADSALWAYLFRAFDGEAQEDGTLWAELPLRDGRIVVVETGGGVIQWTLLE